jgi:hypothetical protein
MATTPVAYLLQGGVAPGASDLHGYGCASKAANSSGLSFLVDDVTAPGTFTNGSVTYSDATGDTGYVVTAVTITVTKLGGVGDTVVGSLTGTLTHPPLGVAESLAASFTLCHIPDEDAP